MKLYQVEYLGYATADRRLSSPMIPWILAEIRKGGNVQKMSVGVNDGHLCGYVAGKDEPLLHHALSQIARPSVIHGNVTTFLYFVHDKSESLLYCYLFQTTEPDDVMELFSSMREQSNRVNHPVRSLSSAATLTSLCADISPSSSHFFEVLYIGKIKVPSKKVPDTFIDDALDKFRSYEQEKEKRVASLTNKGEENSNSQQKNEVKEQTSLETPTSGTESVLTPPSEPSDTVQSTNSSHSAEIKKTDTAITTTSSSSSVTTTTTKPTASESRNTSVPDKPVLETMRVRSGSVGSLLIKKPENLAGTHHQKSDDNRTMVFQVGHTDLRLISPDRKQILLHKHLRDVATCIQGTKHGAYFGFICKEANAESYIGYVFKCQSESVADDVVGAITQAYLAVNDNMRKEKQAVISCDHCPMVWYHKLCAEIESLSDKRVQAAIFRRLELLPEEEQEVVLTKLRGAETISGASLKEQNELLMMLLRAHCESKQSRHVHDTAENRHEFLNQYLGGSTIFMKAKRSLTSSFDQLLKRKGSKDDLGPMIKELSLPMNATLCKDNTTTTITTTTSTAPSSGNNTPVTSTPATLEVPQTPPGRPRSSTISSETSIPPINTAESQQKASNMMNIFLKVGNSPKSPQDEDSSDDGKKQGSWRQAIFNTVVTPNKNLVSDKNAKLSGLTKRDKADLRALWRKAINQQVLLIRMEKENAKLKARQEEATVKRIKLEYDDIGSSGRHNMEVWEMIINKETRKPDNKLLVQAVREGVPRSKRGEVWIFLAEQYCAKIPPFDCSKFPNYNVPYEDLLKQLTSQQHAILIDLGRTFPTHTYFMSPLGPGQLALFNLLKAYSLLDPEVGYCQGLSFVAGVLLLHMTEEQAFYMLRHLMFRRQLRQQYLPDMVALQVQLYQLSRLLHDTHPELYAHLDKYEVSPTLYAAPWLLTVFASQFPLGFVTRVFDLMFIEGPEVLFRVALSLLSYHKEGLLKCDSFELVMEYLKTALPEIDKEIMDKIMKQVFCTDISKQLHEYGVEYHVLQEEMSTPRPETKKLKQLEASNKTLTIQNRALTEQLEIATSNIHRLETSRTSHMMSLNRLESQVRSLEVTVQTLGNFISTLAYNNTDLEIPSEISRIIAELNVSERRKSVTSNVLRPGNNNQQPNNRGIPLKVIDTNNQNEDNKKKHRSPPPLKSAISSPNLPTKASSFFANSYNQIKQQKMGIVPNEQTKKNNMDHLEISSNMKKSLSDSKDLKLFVTKEQSKELLNVHQRENSDFGVRLGRVLTEEDKKALRLMDVDSTDSYGKSISMPPPDSKKKLKSSQSSFELGKSGSVSSMPSHPVHPLDSDSVNISFGGTTKLKQIRPLRTRQGSSSSFTTSPTSSMGSLCGSEDKINISLSNNNQVQLKIVETQDVFKSSNRKNNKTSPPSSDCEEFAKHKGKETKLMIESQVPAKQQTSLLT